MSEPNLRELADEEFAHLTTVGRKTGRPHEIEIWFAAEGDSIYMLSGGRERSEWVRNLMKTSEVRMRIAAEIFEGRARVIEGEDDDPLARRLLVEKYERETGRLARWRETSLPVRVDFSA